MQLKWAPSTKCTFKVIGKKNMLEEKIIINQKYTKIEINT